MLEDLYYQIPEPMIVLQSLRPDTGWCKDRRIDQCDKRASLESMPHVNGHLVYGKCQCSVVGKDSLFNKHSRSYIGYPHRGKKRFNPFLMSYTKINFI